MKNSLKINTEIFGLCSFYSYLYLVNQFYSFTFKMLIKMTTNNKYFHISWESNVGFIEFLLQAENEKHAIVKLEESGELKGYRSFPCVKEITEQQFNEPSLIN